MDSEIKEEVPVHEEFILCCGVETQVLKCGPWTNLFSEPRANRPKLLIFIITGNPGFSAFYVPFAKALYSSINRRFPVWVISHAGHVLVPKGKKVLITSDGMSLLTSPFLYSEWVFMCLESLLRLRVTPLETSACGIGPMLPRFGNFRIFKLLFIFCR